MLLEEVFTLLRSLDVAYPLRSRSAASLMSLSTSSNCGAIDFVS